MKKGKIIYWSGTGNTEKMAESIKEGMQENLECVEIIPVEGATKEMVEGVEYLALGCPSMGVEVLEEDSMEPFIESLKDIDLSSKKILLFGSYNWGDGQWMTDWESRMKDYGANLVQEGLMIQLEPDEEGIQLCKEAGKTLTTA